MDLNRRMQQVEDKVGKMDSKVDSMNRTVGSMNTKIGQMVILLTGNKELDMDDKGMIGELSEMKLKLEKLEKFKDRMTWVFITVGAVTGLNIVQIIQLAVKAFHK